MESDDYILIDPELRSVTYKNGDYYWRDNVVNWDRSKQKFVMPKSINPTKTELYIQQLRLETLKMLERKGKLLAEYNNPLRVNPNLINVTADDMAKMLPPSVYKLTLEPTEKVKVVRRYKKARSSYKQVY